MHLLKSSYSEFVLSLLIHFFYFFLTIMMFYFFLLACPDYGEQQANAGKDKPSYKKKRRYCKR